MGRYAQFVVGPAGSGKSTYCFTMQNHMLSNRLRLQPKVINLDPGQERSEEAESKFPFDVDVRDLISVSDVTEELQFGPNGALVFCMEHLCENLNWLKESLDEVGGSDDEYFIFDCPGQIELYTHIPVLRTVIQNLQAWNIHVCVVHVIDALFIDDTSKYISGALLALTSMMQLQTAAVNVITKCDIKKNTHMGSRKRKSRLTNRPLQAYKEFLQEKNVNSFLDTLESAEEEMEGARDAEEAQDLDIDDGDDYESPFLNVEDPEFFNPDGLSLRASIQESSGSERAKHLSESICTVLENYNLVHFLPLDVTNEDSIDIILAHIDNATQYGEDLEPRGPGEGDEDQEEQEGATGGGEMGGMMPPYLA